jgi:hypothetical protein
MQEMRRIPRGDLIEREMQARQFLNELEDTREAAVAFVERRTPNFRGK